MQVVPVLVDNYAWVVSSRPSAPLGRKCLSAIGCSKASTTRNGRYALFDPPKVFPKVFHADSAASESVRKAPFVEDLVYWNRSANNQKTPRQLEEDYIRLMGADEYASLGKDNVLAKHAQHANGISN